jgi:F1F0 ATPase subunit 2
MMNETLSLVVGLVAGIVLGGFFFGGLWWTVRKGVASEYAALWFIGSLALRTTVVLLGFYVVGADNWQRLLAALLGLLVARLIVMKLTRAKTPSRPLVKGAPHAP